MFHRKRQPVFPFLPLLAGAGIGALVGVLMAPRSGTESQQWLAGKAGEGMEGLKDRLAPLKDSTEERIRGAKTRLTEAVAVGREAYAAARRRSETRHQASEIE